MLKNKKILVYGLGLTGRELVKFLLDKGAVVYIYDDKNFLKLNNTIWLSQEDISKINFAVISPGVEQTKMVQALKIYKVPIYSELKFASMFVKGKIIAVTGTNGKTTTVTLLSEIFKKANINHCLCGNVGKPLISCLDKNYDYYICEISSFQLEYLGEFKPYISALLNIAPDHLSRHKDMESYEKIKFSIFDNVKNAAIINNNLKNNKLTKNIKKELITFSAYENADVHRQENFITYNDISLNLDFVKLKGNKNIENIMVCVAISKLCKIPNESIIKGVYNFCGLPHRIQFVLNNEGVDYINDSKATNPDSTCSALECFKNVILLLGGFDKGLSYLEIFKFGNIKKIVLFGKAKNVIFESAKSVGFDNVVLADDLYSAVKMAKGVAVAGDTVLLSPACSSYDAYKNYEERGEDFKNICFQISGRGNE